MAYDIAIPEDDAGSFGDYLYALKRRRLSALVIFVTILVAGTVLTVFLPNTYRSTATILIEQPEVPPGLIQTTVTTFAAQQLQYITQRVMTRSNLSSIIEKFDLYSDQRRYLPTLMLVDEAQDDMSVDLVDVKTADAMGRAMQTTIAFTLSFEHEDPKTAQAVANELVSLYMDENVRTRTIQTAETSEFVQQEVDRLDEEVRGLESELAAFKSENEGSLPELANMNLQMMQRIDSELLEVRRALDRIEESRVLMQAQLAQLDPLAASLLPDGRTVVSPTDQLKAKKTQLAMLEGRYSPDHPDVAMVRREISALEAQIGASGVDLVETQKALQDAETSLAIARERYTNDHPEVQRLQRQVESLEDQLLAPRVSLADNRDVQADNPAYMTLSMQLQTLDINERALRKQESELKRRLADYEEKLLRSSEVERDLRALGRQLNTATQQYLMAREKLFSAELGQALETQSKGERFSLVEPADLPLTPASPNRPVLLALFLVMSLAAGLGWPQVAAVMNSAVSGPKSLQRIFGAPPIAEIPNIVTEADDARQRKLRFALFLVIPVVIILGLLIVHFLITPLDVLWYVSRRRIGL